MFGRDGDACTGWNIEGDKTGGRIAVLQCGGLV
jgi:hypothetical protein